MSVPADAMQAGGVAPWNTPPPSASTAGGTAPWDTPPPAAPMASTPAQSTPATDALVKDAAHGWTPAQQEADRAKVWGNSPSSTPDLGPNPTEAQMFPNGQPPAASGPKPLPGPSSDDPFHGIEAWVKNNSIAAGHAITASMFAGPAEAASHLSAAAYGAAAKLHTGLGFGAAAEGAQANAERYAGQARRENRAANQEAPVGAVAGSIAGSVAPMLVAPELKMAELGTSPAARVATDVLRHAPGAIAASIAPTINTATEALKNGATIQQADELLAAGGVANTIRYMMPASLDGGLVTRATTGFLLNAAASQEQNTALHGIAPGQIAKQTEAQTMGQGGIGAVIAAVLGGHVPDAPSVMDDFYGSWRRAASPELLKWADQVKTQGTDLMFVPAAAQDGEQAAKSVRDKTHIQNYSNPAYRDAYNAAREQKMNHPAAIQYATNVAANQAGHAATLASLQAMRSQKVAMTAQQNIADLVASAKAAGVPEGHIQTTLGAGQGKSALATMTALHQLIALHQSGQLPAEAPHGNPDQGRQGAQAQGHETAVGPAQGQQAEHGQEAGTGQPVANQPEGGQAEVSPRAAPVVARLQAAGVEAPVHADGRVVVHADHQQADAAATIGAHDAAESPLNDRREPTDGQKAAGTYPKGKLLFRSAQGDIKVNIENPAGSVRRSIGETPAWSRTLMGGVHYGYLPGTKAPDGQPVDVLVGPKAHDDSLPVFVIHQTAKDGSYDEPKVVMGSKTARQALNVYRMQYPQSMHAGLTQMEPKVVQMARPQFVDWIKNGPHDVPLHPVSKQPMLKLRQQVPFEAAFGHVPRETLDAEVGALNDKHGTQLQVEPTSTGLRVAGDVPRAVASDLHRSLSKVEGHEQTTIAHTDAGSILRAGREENGPVTRSGRQEVQPAAPAEQRGRAGIPQGAPEAQEAQPPNWLNKPKSSAPVYQGGQGAHPVSVVGVHYAEKPNLTELPAEKSTDDLANARLFHVRESRDLPAAASNGHAHETQLTNLYDIHKDPEGLGAHGISNGKPDEATMRAIRDAGYDGVVMRGAHDSKPIAWVFSHGPIPVKAVGPAAPHEDLAAAKPVARKSDAQIEDDFARQIGIGRDGVVTDEKAFGAAVKRYEAISETDGGKIVSGDIAKELSPDYMADRARAAAAHEPASSFAKEYFKRRLEEPATRGQYVLFTAGGTGAGKTTALSGHFAPLAKDAFLIYDGNMNTASSAIKKVDQVLASDRKVKVGLVYRDPVEALVDGALARAERQRALHGTGRVVPMEAHLDTHVGALETVLELRQQFAGSRLVSFVGVDNRYGKNNARDMSLDTAKELLHNRDKLKQDLRVALDEAYRKGAISKETYHGSRGIQEDDAGAEARVDSQQRRSDGDGGGDRRGHRSHRQDASGADRQPEPERDGERPDAVEPHGTRLPIEEIPVANLGLSDDVPQFKSGANDEGVVEPLGGTYDRRGTAPIQVWRRTSGKLEVISGRHRLDLAKRSGETTIPAQVYDESKGFTREKAATLDAELNIRDGQGKVKDYVNYFKSPGLTKNEAESRGLLARSTGKRAYTIASEGDEGLIANHRADKITDEAAVQIAHAAPNNAKLQALGMKLVQDGKSITLAANTMRAVQTMMPSASSGDLFGFDDSAIQEGVKMAAVASAKQREISERLAAITGASKRPELAKKEGIDVRNPHAMAARISQLRAEKDAWDNWATDPEKVADIRDELGMEPRPEPEAPAPAAPVDTQTHDMFGAPTSGDHLDAAERARDAARNGLTGTGRTDMLSGDGDLFAGRRPDQGTIEERGAQYGLFDPYEGKETRPDAGEVIDAGRQAFHRFLGRYGGTVFGDSIGQELRQSGRAELIGKTIRSADDLAALAAVYRNPTFETLHYVMTNDHGEVVFESAYSSRLPATAAIFSPSKTILDVTGWLHARAKETGATKLWLLHNHPSGNPEPSVADIGFTRELNDALANTNALERNYGSTSDLGFGGHVVIDHDRYALIDASGPSGIYPITEPHTNFRGLPSKASPLLGASVLNRQGLADVGVRAFHDLPNQVGIVVGGRNSEVTQAFALPTDVLKSPRGAMLLRRIGQRSGGHNVFAVLPTGNDPALTTAVERMLANNVLRDVVRNDGTVFPANPAYEHKPVLGRAPKAMRVHEDNDGYELTPDAQHEPTVPPFDREQAANLDYRKADPKIQQLVARGAFRSALAQVDRITAATDRAFRSAEAMFDRRPPADNIRDIAKSQRGEPIADPAAASFFHATEAMFNQRVEMIRGFGEGDLENVLHNYFPQLWKDPNKAKAFYAEFTKRPLEGSKAFLKHREFPTIEDGMKAGLVPTSTNPADLARIHLYQMDKFIALHTFKLELIQRGMVAKIAPGQRLPLGYARVNDSSFEIAGGLQGAYAVPERIAHDINNYLQPGFTGAPWRAFRSFQNILLSARLGLSLFHAGFTTIDHTVIHLDLASREFFNGHYKKAGELFAKGLASPLTAAQGLANRGAGAQLVRQYIGQAPVDPHTEAVLGALSQGGARAFMHPTMELNSLHNAVRAFRQNNKLALTGRFIPATIEAVMYPVAHYLVPAQKMAARVALMKYALDQNAETLGKKPGDYAGIVEAMHPDYLRQIASKVVDQVDDRLGQLNYDNLFMNQFLKQALQATVQSVGWNVGSARVIGGGIGDVRRLSPYAAKIFGGTRAEFGVGAEKGVSPVSREGGEPGNLPRMTGRLSYLISLHLALGFAGALFTYLATGHGPKQIKDLFYPEGPGGIRMAFPTYIKDEYAVGTHPLDTVIHKMNPALSMMAEMLQNRDYYGTKIFEEGRTSNVFGNLLQHVEEAADYLGKSFLPYAVQNVEHNRAKGAGIGMQIAPFFGVTSAPADIQRSAFQNYVANRYAEEYYGGSRSQAQTEHSQALSRAVQTIRNGGVPDWKGLTPADHWIAEKYAKTDPYEGMFRRLPLEQRIHAYNAASPQERQKLRLRQVLLSGNLNVQLQRLPGPDREWAQHELNKIRSE